MLRILSLDGGGLRGIIPVQVLKHIETITGTKTIDNFDFFSGTSTGGLIAAGLTVKGEDGFSPKHSIEDIEKVYLERGNQIFKDRGFFGKLRHKIKSWTEPRYDASGLQVVLEDLLKDERGNQLKVSDCLKPILIPAYNLKANAPLFFKSRYAFEDRAKNYQLIDVCRSTSAAPTYLPSYSFTLNSGGNEIESYTAIDGGIFINNPSMAALIEVLKYKDHEFYNFPEIEDEDIFVLSIGTGHYTKNIAEESRSWGKLKWIKPLFDIMMWGNTQAVDYQLNELLHFPSMGRLNYLRINVDIKDEKFVDMTKSDDKTLEYLQGLVYNDYLNNSYVQEQLGGFIEDSHIGDHGGSTLV